MPKNKKLSRIDKERIGFYHLVLEMITGENDIDTIQNMIQDTEYRGTVFGEKVNDYGIDAVYINKEKGAIQLFSFKYHSDGTKANRLEGEIISNATKFLNKCFSSGKMKINSIVDKHINDINTYLYDDIGYPWELYCVTNVANGFDKREEDVISNFENTYTISVIPILVSDIVNNIVTKESKANCAILVKDGNYFISKNRSISTDISYICKISLYDLVRITSNSDKERMNYNDNTISINNAKLDYTIYNDNVRGYIKKSKYNKKVISTIENEGNNFFLYNNGITFTCKNVKADMKKYPKKNLLLLENFQIVNGGQTVRNVYEYISRKNYDVNEQLKNVFVLLKIIDLNNSMLIKEKISEYTNTQNPISKIDLKSNQQIQKDIEKYLASEQIVYVRKNGDVGISTKSQKRISMVKFTQILYSAMGYPERVSNQKNRLFDEYYDDIYESPNFEIEKSKMFIEKYNEIKEYYNNSTKIKFEDQKAFYIIYLYFNYNVLIKDAIKLLEKALNDNKKIKRPMLKSAFKDSLSNYIK